MMYVCMYGCMYECIYVCMYVCMYLCKKAIPYMHSITYTHNLIPRLVDDGHQLEYCSPIHIMQNHFY